MTWRFVAMATSSMSPAGCDHFVARPISLMINGLLQGHIAKLQSIPCWKNSVTMVWSTVYSTILRLLSPSYNCPNPNRDGVSVLTTANQQSQHCWERVVIRGLNKYLDKLDSRKIDRPAWQSQNFGRKTHQDATSWCFKNIIDLQNITGHPSIGTAVISGCSEYLVKHGLQWKEYLSPCL